MDKKTLQPMLETYFTWFHRHPELGFAEHKTTARIRELLREAGVEILDTPLATGVVARIQGRPGGPVTALRADIDGLPITETADVGYPSEHPGCMHACGHDFHLTALLGAALLLREEAETLAGTVKLVFQPAEEGAGGAQAVLDTGILDDVDEIYGLHVTAGLAPGSIALSPGATYAAVGSFRILVKGRGGHAAEPHHCQDPIVAAARIITEAQTVISRGVDPFDPAVLSITRVQAGTAWNVIPSEAQLEGTIRALSTEKLTGIAEGLGKICRGVEESGAAAIEYTWRIATYSTNNDPALTQWAAETAKSLDLPVGPYPPALVGEDFALYQQRIPGVFLNIGVGSPRELHNPGFIANPAPLAAAAELLAALGKGSLARLARNSPPPLP